MKKRREREGRKTSLSGFIYLCICLRTPLFYDVTQRVVVVHYRLFGTTSQVPPSRVKILGPSRRKPEIAHVYLFI